MTFVTRLPRITLGVCILAAYFAATLYPYDWTTSGPVRNSAGFGADGAFWIAPPGPGIAHTPTGPGWVDAAIRRVRPASLDQDGPARILTLSKDPFFGNFTVGQAGHHLNVRVRSPWQTLNGFPGAQALNVFTTRDWVEIRLRVEPGQLRVAINGEPRVWMAFPEVLFEDWDQSYRLALGNELTLNRPWVGEIARAEVRVGETVVDYAKPGVLEIPATLPGVVPELDLVPFRGILLQDGLLNVIMFVPLGVLAGIWIGVRRGRGKWPAFAFAVGFVALFSSTLEVLQLGIPERFTSFDDVILNTLGGAFGVLLARQLAGKWAQMMRIFQG
jgi:hypothetical protein